MAIPFTKAWRAKKAAKETLKVSRTFYWSYADIRDLSGLKAAIDAGDAEKCRELLAAFDKPVSWAAAREWLDILVVSMSVAMAFRAYFYEPFNIPTGSMQPTLYGNHSRAIAEKDATWVDTSPLKWAKWAATGEMFESFKAPCSGELGIRPRNDGYYDMFVVNTETYRRFLAWQRANPVSKLLTRLAEPKGTPINPAVVPTDVLRSSAGDAPVAGETPRLPNGLQPGGRVRKGDLLWSGYVITGDFLFVNRWIWNFRPPERGDVMVFSTTGIKDLQQGTHYIKRMTGTPGETLVFKEGRLFVDGKAPMEPLRVRQIQEKTSYAPGLEPEYAGYRPTSDKQFTTGKTIPFEGSAVTLGADEYYACGDNSRSSYDSRYWGPVPAANLRGAAGGVFWPLSHRWGNVK